jgi:uncharacterized membrane protein YcaP (DUF421 family)
MTQTLYPHEWILKRAVESIPDIMDLLLIFTLGGIVGMCLVNQRFLWLVLSIAPLAIVITAFVLALHYMTRGQYYGMNKI